MHHGATASQHRRAAILTVSLLTLFGSSLALSDVALLVLQTYWRDADSVELQTAKRRPVSGDCRHDRTLSIGYPGLTVKAAPRALQRGRGPNAACFVPAQGGPWSGLEPARVCAFLIFVAATLFAAQWPRIFHSGAPRTSRAWLPLAISRTRPHRRKYLILHRGVVLALSSPRRAGVRRSRAGE